MAEGGSETRSRPEEVIALSLPQFPQVVAEGESITLIRSHQMRAGAVIFTINE